jgi:hypothetical protein
MGRSRSKRPKPKGRQSSRRVHPADPTFDPTPEPTDLLGLKGTAAGKYRGMGPNSIGDFARGLRDRRQLRGYRDTAGRWTVLMIFLAILMGLVVVAILLNLVNPPH